jgi:hypothetical protein
MDRCKFKLCRSNLSRWFGNVFNQLAVSMSSPAVCEYPVGAVLSGFPSGNKVSGDTSGDMEGKLLCVVVPALLAPESRCGELEDAF